MKVLVVHNRYQVKGGEDSVFETEIELLESNGIQVKRLEKNNNSLSFLDKIRLIFRTHFNKRSFNEMISFLEEERPDIVHVHNFFPQLSPSIFYACQLKNIPCVYSLHNYRIMSPNGLLYDKGEIDLSSVVGSAYSTIWRKIYRNSYLQTAVVAYMIEYNKRKNTWAKAVDGFISFSRHSANIFEEFGLPSDKIFIKPHFVDIESNPKKEQRDHYVFGGRISEEKGIVELLEIWKNFDQQLHVIGDGPLLDPLKEKYANIDSIEFLDRLEKDDLIENIGRSKAVIFPSQCFETFGMIIAEAFAMATPVIVNAIGNQSKMITDGHNGFHFDLKSPQSLRDVINKIDNNVELQACLSKNSRNTYLKEYTPEINYKKLIDIYQALIERKNGQVKSS